ncbi:MAG TPA: methylated-DNA--[protein]-cysteine S-methyltransferase [Kiritimatiellia bacterium]|nr:methylated-DNA--[protein]-cysteine S-methyltransferase [Lentisphaerota bacterium]HPC18891.1 methylated-DNA--[protein]-cysteine S-methyltransferase [Kiritimatiellia bacterium]HQN80000.1 methylated-DNA--[protein]-cysteine S-methyltransferase [Kiritimatiellia bacterium]HQQ60469.1 methylated-DNA--[protein]-cysteine S-methyltransferase [Kiritimatiellia bacterium]
MKAAPNGLQRAVLETTWGAVSIHAGRQGVWSCDLPPAPRQRAMPRLRVLSVKWPLDPDPVLRRAVAYARAVLAGRTPPSLPPVHPAVFESAAPFYRSAWRALRGIPRGARTTYARLAARAGRPAAARAAGGACRANPVPLFLPCHRVMAANGQWGGFSAGLPWKIHLLRLEGVGS